MGTNCFSEQRVFGQAGLVDRFQIERHKTLALLVSDSEVPVNIDDVSKPQCAREPTRSA
jgi:hypothetical protein